MIITKTTTKTAESPTLTTAIIAASAAASEGATITTASILSTANGTYMKSIYTVNLTFL